MQGEAGDTDRDEAEQANHGGKLVSEGDAHETKADFRIKQDRTDPCAKIVYRRLKYNWQTLLGECLKISVLFIY